MTYCRLNAPEITKAMARQELKRWWVAEQTGIHITTLRRWMSGRIERVTWDHAEQLARVLTVPVAEIAQTVTLSVAEIADSRLSRPQID